MRIAHLQIRHFRCFSSLDLALDNPITVIEGLNGTGKTSLLEALHYLCYLRSFRTHLPQELVQFGHESFFIKARLHGSTLELPPEYDLQVGFSNKKRLVKINDRLVSSYKELLEYCRIVTLTEDDLAIIKEGPEVRRLFIDQAITLTDADFVVRAKRCRDIVEQRNALLKKGCSAESYHLWSEQLWIITLEIQATRQQLLAILQQQVKELITTYFSGQFSITFSYQPKKMPKASYQDFCDAYPTLMDDELRMSRSLFGAHLDDFQIHFQESKSRNFASRGQQKLIVLLLKVAQIKRLMDHRGPAVFLLDDFMTDFDLNRAEILLTMLADLPVQLIFTVPTFNGFLQEKLLLQGATTLKLTD